MLQTALRLHDNRKATRYGTRTWHDGRRNSKVRRIRTRQGLAKNAVTQHSHEDISRHHKVPLHPLACPLRFCCMEWVSTFCHKRDTTTRDSARRRGSTSNYRKDAAALQYSNAGNTAWTSDDSAKASQMRETRDVTKSDGPITASMEGRAADLRAAKFPSAIPTFAFDRRCLTNGNTHPNTMPRLAGQT